MKFALIFAVAARAFACHALDGDRIFAKDLAAANPAFAVLDPQLEIAPAPLPGVQRVFHASDLLRLARANGLTLASSAAEVCFERQTRTLTAEEILPALRADLEIDGARIEVLDFTRARVPVGALRFTRAGLSLTGFWRGQVDFGGNRTSPVWAKVRITTEQTWIEAAEPLASGKAIEAAQIRLAHGPRSPLGPVPLASAGLVVGCAPSRAVKPGEPIFANMLRSLPEIERGDKVAVEVTSGAAHLSFDGISQACGRTGDLILIRNPENGRYFQARVDGKDKVSIHK